MSTPQLVRALVDDAGLFPPTSLDMPAAVQRHRQDQQDGQDMLTHRFLCPASRLGELRAALAGTDRIRLGLITDQGDDGLDAVLETVADDQRLDLVLLEVPLATFGQSGTGPAVAAAMQALQHAPESVPTYVEPATVDDIDDLTIELGQWAGSRPVGAKLRCGGVRAELFPSPKQVAHFVATCAHAGVPLKATAGLHQPVRHRNPETGFSHHGYLNLLLAAASAGSGATEADLQPLLEIERPDELAQRIAELSADEATSARQVLVSYGSCSTRTPVTQARELLSSTPERTDRT